MSKKTHKTSVGGQALIEGIMMRGPKGSAMSVRLPDGTIETEYKSFKTISQRSKFFRLPLIRGIFSYIDSMIIGYKCLMESAEKAGMDMDDEDPENMSKIDRWLTEHLNEKLMSVISAVAMVLGLVVAFALFFWLPTYLTDKMNEYLFSGAITNVRPLIEGIMRMIIFIAYIAIVSQSKDIKRVFMYHGAEHKTIFCYENGCELTVENVRKQSRFHPRCGTSFIVVILVISILLSSALAIIAPGLREIRLLWICAKILLLPIVAALGYEFIRYAGRHDNFIIRIFSAPGLWMQRLTTKEPTDDIIEVGIAAFKAVITDNPEDDEIK